MTALQTLGRVLPAAFDFLLGRLCLWFATASLAFAFAIVCAQVFWRYVLNDSLVWAEELTRFAVIWATMVGAAAAYRRGQHIGVTVLLERLRTPWRGLLVRAVHLFVLAFVLVVLWESWHFTLRNFERGQLTAAMQVQIAWAHLALPVGSFLIALAVLESLWRGTPPTSH